MNKNILIVGPSRTGKTKLANLISKELGYNIVRVDSLLIAFMYAYPLLGIDFHYDEGINAKRMSPFINVLLASFNLGQDIKSKTNYVLEGVYIDFEEIFKSFDRDDFIIIGLKYSDISRNDLLKKIRENDDEFEWTFHDSDEDLLIKLDYFLEKNKDFINMYDKYNIKSYCTTDNRDEVFNQILSDIKDNTKEESFRKVLFPEQVKMAANKKRIR